MIQLRLYSRIVSVPSNDGELLTTRMVQLRNAGVASFNCRDFQQSYNQLTEAYLMMRTMWVTGERENGRIINALRALALQAVSSKNE